MTVFGLIRRFFSNIRLFPALALVAFIVLVAEFSSMLWLVGLVTNGRTGLWAATGILLIEFFLAFSIAYVILNDKSLSYRVQSWADWLVNSASVPFAAASTDDYNENEDDYYNENEELDFCGDPDCPACHPDTAENL